MEVKLAVGIRDGQPIHISELTLTEKGLKCNCTCPECGGVLEARLGTKRRWHFKHHESCNCDPAHAQETGLHRLAKEIIKKNSSILVPGLIIERREVRPENSDIFIAAEVKINLPSIDAMPLEYDSVEIEKPFEGIIADAVVTKKRKPVIVEIFVTHQVDDEKKGKLDALGIPAFEIDLRDLLKAPQTRESIERSVLDDVTNREWVCNPKREQLLAKAKAEFKEKYDAIIRSKEQEEDKKREFKERNTAALQKLLEPGNYALELERLRNDEQADYMLKRYFRFGGITDYPFFMDIPITGEIVFDCDRRIWQGKLFNDYVYWAFGEKEMIIFDSKEIQNRIFKNRMQFRYDKKGCPAIRFDKSKTCHTTIVLNGREEEVSFSRDVINRYFDYLCLLGFMYWSGWKGNSERRGTIEPRNATAAAELKRILETIDRDDPDVSHVIQQELAQSLPEPDRTRVLSWGLNWWERPIPTGI